MKIKNKFSKEQIGVFTFHIYFRKSIGNAKNCLLNVSSMFSKESTRKTSSFVEEKTLSPILLSVFMCSGYFSLVRVFEKLRNQQVSQMLREACTWQKSWNVAVLNSFSIFIDLNNILPIILGLLLSIHMCFPATESRINIGSVYNLYLPRFHRRHDSS